MRARVLGTLPEVSYRNAMMTVSSLGWLRAEPGQTAILERLGQGRVPIELFRTITSRVPEPLQDEDPAAAARLPKTSVTENG